MVKNKFLVYLLLINGSSFATAQILVAPAPSAIHKSVASVPISVPANKLNTLNAKSSVIDEADQDSDNINIEKRKLELAKLDADIKKMKNTGNPNSNLVGQTTTRNVFIDQDGLKYATLQFIDGSTLDVEIGSRIGNYKVSDISMNGVTIIASNCKTAKCKEINLKRSYSSNDISSVSTNTSRGFANNTNPYLPTPIINNEMVPPIIANH